MKDDKLWDSTVIDIEDDKNIPLKTLTNQAIESQNATNEVAPRFHNMGLQYLTSLPSSKDALLFIISIATSLPLSIYSFTYPMKISPEFLTKEKWELESTVKQMQCVIFALTTIAVASTVLYQHIPTMLKRAQELLLSFRDIFIHFNEAAPTFLKNCFVFVLSFLAALASLALGYYGFLWGGLVLAIGAAGINFLMTLGFRLEYLPALIEKIHTIFDENSRFQMELISELKHLDSEFIEEFEFSLKIEMHGKPINDEVMRICLLKLYDKAENHPEIFRALNMQDTVVATLQKIADVVLGAYVGIATTIFYAQYGYDGFKILFQSMVDLNNLPYAAQLIIGLMVATSSGVMGFMTALDITKTIQFTLEYIKQDPAKNSAKVALLTTGCVISATSLAGAINAMTSKPNLFNIVTDSAASYLLLGGNCAFGVSLNTGAILPMISKYEGTHNNAIHWLNKNKLSDQSIRALREHSVFKKQKGESLPLLMKGQSTSFLHA